MTYLKLIDCARTVLRDTMTECIVAASGKNLKDEAAEPHMVSIFAGNNEGYYIATQDYNGNALYYVRTHGDVADALKIHNILFSAIQEGRT